LLLSAGLAQAEPVINQGTWYGSGTADGNPTLLGRDINGNPVPLLLGVAPTPILNPAAVFLYDTVQNLTWYNDSANPVTMTWDAAVAWAANLDVGGFNDWELPKIDYSHLPDSGWPDCGLTTCGDNVNTSGSEWAHLWYETLGNTAGSMTNTGPFQNLQSHYYWSGTEYTPARNDAWFFSTLDGYQSGAIKFLTLYALAVRPGDVVAASVPEPQPLVLALFGLVALWVAGRRRPHRGLGASEA